MLHSPSFFKTNNEKSIQEIASDILIAYGIRQFDPFFSLLSIQSIEMFELKIKLSVNPKDQSIPTVIEKEVLQRLMEIGIKGMYTFWSRGNIDDFYNTQFEFETIHSDDFKYGDDAFLHISLEKTVGGVSFLEAHLISVSTSMDTTVTKTVSIGEGKVFFGSVLNEKEPAPLPSSESANEKTLEMTTIPSASDDASTPPRQSLPQSPTGKNQNLRNDVILHVPKEFVEDSTCYDDVATGSFSRLFSSLSSTQISVAGEISIEEIDDCSTFIESDKESARSPLTKKKKNEETPCPQIEGPTTSTVRMDHQIIVDIELGKSCGLKFDQGMKVVLVENHTVCEGKVFVGDVVKKVNGKECLDIDEFYYHFYNSMSFATIDLTREDVSFDEMRKIYQMQQTLQNESSRRSAGYFYGKVTISSDGKDGFLGCKIRSWDGKVYVWDVEFGSLAEKYVKKGDRIWEVNANRVLNDYETCHLISYFFEKDGEIVLCFDRPMSCEAKLAVEMTMGAMENGLSNGIPLMVQIPPRSAPPSIQFESSATCQHHSPIQSTALHTVESTVSILSIFASPEKGSRMNPSETSEQCATKKWKNKGFESMPVQRFLPTPGADDSEFARLELAQDSNFTIINVKNRQVSSEPYSVISKLLEQIGLTEGFRFISTTRLPLKGARYAMNFVVWNPIQKKILYKLIGSEKLWMKRFNIDIMKQEDVFIWTGVPIDLFQTAVFSTILKQFDVNYALPEDMNTLKKDLILNDIKTSSHFKAIIAEAKKVLWESTIRDFLNQ